MKIQPKPLRGEQLTPAMADALVAGFPGAAAMAEQVPEKLRAVSGIADEPGAAALVPGTAGAAGRMRWPGVRDAVTADHPVAVTLRAALTAAPGHIPAPDPPVVALLEREEGFTREGHIVSIDGVPVPAGLEQTAYFVVLRYRNLFSPFADPARIYRGDLAYDAANATDELQESILLVSTAIYRDQLALLQRNAPALYLAMWLRRTDVLDDLVAGTPADLLPPPYPRSRFSARRRCLLIATDIMMEWERVCELQLALRSIGGVTRDSVRSALESTSSMSEVRAVRTATGRHIAGAVAHARVIHPTMNEEEAADNEDAVLGTVIAGFDNSPVHGTRYGGVRWVAGGMPTRFFLGLEPTMLVPVALIQMHETLVAHEKRFWQGKRSSGLNDAGTLATRIMSLAIIVVSNICPPTARAMMHDKADDGMLRDRALLLATLPPLIRNPKMEEALLAASKRSDEDMLHDPAVTGHRAPAYAPGDREMFKNSYGDARKRASKCSKPIGKPGWTQGFRQDAWRQPLAEVDFLRDCCRYVRFEKELVPREEQWRSILDKHERSGMGVESLATIHTGLGQQHLLERVQDLFRQQLDRLQVAESTRDAKSSAPFLLREALIRIIAPALAGLSPITDDPALNERFRVDRDSEAVRIARDGAWNI